MTWLIKLMKRSWRNLFMRTQKLEVQEVNPDAMPYYTIAKAEIGVSEILGSKHADRILQYHQATDLKASTDEISWCSSFVNWCMKEAGMPYTNKANARSWVKWGHRVKKPNKGSTVCVFWRGKRDGWQGHVGFFAGEDEDNILVLGGNQGNQVCYKWYSKDQLLEYRDFRI
jgi:uncharacterized protein (TIGR02594 family)